MKKNIYIVITALTISFACLNLYSQKEDFMNSTPEYRAQLQTDWFQKELGLDSITTIQVHKLNLKYACQTEKFKSENPNRFEILKKAKEISEVKEVELEKLLEKEQFQTYIKRRYKLRQKMGVELRKNRSKKELEFNTNDSISPLKVKKHVPLCNSYNKYIFKSCYC